MVDIEPDHVAVCVEINDEALDDLSCSAPGALFSSM